MFDFSPVPKSKKKETGTKQEKDIKWCINQFYRETFPVLKELLNRRANPGIRPAVDPKLISNLVNHVKLLVKPPGDKHSENFQEAMQCIYGTIFAYADSLPADKARYHIDFECLDPILKEVPKDSKQRKLLLTWFVEELLFLVAQGESVCKYRNLSWLIAAGGPFTPFPFPLRSSVADSLKIRSSSKAKMYFLTGTDLFTTLWYRSDLMLKALECASNNANEIDINILKEMLNVYLNVSAWKTTNNQTITPAEKFKKLLKYASGITKENSQFLPHAFLYLWEWRSGISNKDLFHRTAHKFLYKRKGAEGKYEFFKTPNSPVTEHLKKMDSSDQRKIITALIQNLPRMMKIDPEQAEKIHEMAIYLNRTASLGVTIPSWDEISKQESPEEEEEGEEEKKKQEQKTLYKRF